LALEQRKIFVPFGFFSFGIDQLTRLVRPERRDTVEELVSFYTRAYVNATWECRDMNTLLEKALAEVARLPEAEQEAIVTLILDEIAAGMSALPDPKINWVARGDVLSGDPSDRPSK
jgi:hypothetical protein